MPTTLAQASTRSGPCRPPRRPRIVRAASAYFAIAFAAGFVLGAGRVTLLEPALGPLASVALEIPIMLAVSWFAARWVLRWFGPTWAVGQAVALGALAWLMLQAAELAIAPMVLAGNDGWWQAYVDKLASPAGLVGVAAQLAFAAAPAILARRASTSAAPESVTMPHDKAADPRPTRTPPHTHR